MAPLAKVLDDLAGIESGFMTTIHAYTNDQNILDLPHKDLRRARAAAINLIPTSTGAAKAIGLVLPHLKGKVDGVSVRAPVPTGSITDLVVTVGREVSARRSTPPTARRPTARWQGILQYQPDPIVSTDIQGSLVLVHLRRAADDGARPQRQGLRLVRQRVGLQLPARRPRWAGSSEMRLPRSVETADVEGKRVLVRADLNVPLEAARSPTTRGSGPRLPTLRLLLDRGAAACSVCSHLGRPKTEEDRRTYAMAPVERRLRELVPDERLEVLENTRFNPGETKNDAGFARELADENDLYVNDAFGSAHRAHSSTEAVAHMLPAYAGLLLLAELDHLGRLLGEVERPFVLIAGGAKVEDKLAVLEHLGGRADRVLIGGKMAEQVREDNPLSYPVELPVDVVAASAFAEDAESKVATVDAIPDGWLGLDIGPATAEAFGAIVRDARTIFWNGPMGVFEWPPFAARHERGRRGRRGRGRVLRRRRRRLGPRDSGARARGSRLLGVDGRRRVARAPGGQGAPRRGGDPGGMR